MLLRWIPIFSILILVSACREDDTGDPTDACNSDFDYAGMYQNLADNLIIPGYSGLLSELETLQSTADAFLAEPDATTLSDLRVQWETSYLAWQQVEAFEFGPAETVFLRNNLNNFPADTAAILSNITQGTFDPDQPDAYDKGLPALDYLLFGLSAQDSEIIAIYQSSESYRNYLQDLAADMVSRVETTYSGWINGYRDSFIANTGNAAGTALSLIINNLNRQYEITKRDRIGIPSGALTLGFTNPDKTEAPFSQKSLVLAKAALAANQNFYSGNSSSGTTGSGLDDLLNFVDARKDGQPLDQIIRDQYQAAALALDAISEPLELAVDSETTIVEAAYAELSRQVINLKTDLPSMLCISITYIDNPSDSD